MTPARLPCIVTGLAVWLAFAPATARAGQVESFDRLSSVLKHGDVVEIVDVSGRRVRGRLSDLTACSVVVARDGAGRVAFALGDVKTIRLVRSAKTDALSAGARTCDKRDCEPLTLVVASMAGVAHGFRAVFTRPRTVYRAPKVQSPRLREAPPASNGSAPADGVATQCRSPL